MISKQKWKDSLDEVLAEHYMLGTEDYENLVKESKVNPIPKFIFIHINKCAGTSIKKCLESVGNPNSIDDELVVSSSGKVLINKKCTKSKDMFPDSPRQHLTAWEYKQLIASYDEYHSFTIVRNPWDRVVSQYFYGGGDPTGFDDYVINIYEKGIIAQPGPHPRMYQPCMRWLVDSQNNLIVDNIGRFENLEDFHKIISELGFKNASLLHLNKRHPTHRRKRRLGQNRIGKSYHEFYTERSRQIIQDAFHEDIEYFGYKFD